MATNRVLFDTPVLIDLLERRPRAINRRDFEVSGITFYTPER
ncbi:MAG: hypothetical protein P4L03_07165 [Terracidiphilus sp.]|nr:hypothetical protein [Terracidiphilus sp.]